MTVSYQYDVASSSTGGFFRLLWRWRGSIWKLLYKELLLFVCVYICIAFTYDFLMSDYYKRYYEHIVVFCSAFVEVIPLSFILGFYVSFTAHRWWQQYTAIPWPDKLMNIIALYIPGNDVTSRVLRRTLMRYLNLTLVLVLRSISIPVKRRFPTKEHLVEAGFMSRPELEIYQSVPSHEFNTFWIPCTWFVNLLREAKSECRITDSGGIKLIMEEFNEFRSKCGLLWSYDWVSIPLVYTQVVTLSTQAFFLASLLGRQHINPSKEIKSHIYGEYYIPIFTMLQFILYMGLLKLGEQLINPFGDDDEDFELNWIIDRHLKVSFLGVDILNSDPPPLIKDNYFDDMDIKLPYTEAAVAHKVKTYRGSVAAFHVPTEKHGLVIPEFEDDYGESTDDEPSTAQSVRDPMQRNSSWSLFGQRKRKLSSSVDSFNSETMVETGLGETEMPDLVESIQSSWPTFLQNEADTNNNRHNNQCTSSGSGSHQTKPSVWPMNKLNDEKANEDTQGIRWIENSGQHQQQSGRPKCDHHHHQQQQQQQGQSQIPKDMYKQQQQSSFSTSDSSIAIALGETTDHCNAETCSPQFFRPRKHPLQVFSKELANAPISVFNQILESNLRRESKNSSLGSLSSRLGQTDRHHKPHKSLIKCQRPIDPKLRIRPFRSKVTFSDDTKSGDNTLRLRSDRPPNNNDSSSESNSSLMRTNQAEHSTRCERSPRKTTRTLMFDANINSLTKTPSAETSFAESCKRRQSLDPSLYRGEKDNLLEEVEKDNWLHYQSLPNIQEENDPSISGLPGPETTPSSVSTEKKHQTAAKSDAQPINILYPTLTPPTMFQAVNPPVANIPPTIQQHSPHSPSSTLSPGTPTANTPSRSRRSFKRQKSQEIPDEDLKQRLAQPTVVHRKVHKQSSDDSQASSTSSSKGVIMPPGILRKRKEDLKQASTESDTGSYHTVKSLLMQASSSIDSFTSAVSESAAIANQATIVDVANNSNNNNNNINNSNKLEQELPCTRLPDERILCYPSIESNLVPKIIFSQSTPSVTSQSSDDQNSPKWDERYSEFSSIETVIDNPQHALVNNQNRNNNNNNNNDGQRSGRSDDLNRPMIIPVINISPDDHGPSPRNKLPSAVELRTIKSKSAANPSANNLSSSN